MMAHADWLLEQWQQGARQIPASMPQIIPLLQS
jgi:hypothetical protein